MKNTRKLITNRDKTIILIIFAAVFAYLVFSLAKDHGNKAVVTIDGKVIKEIPLDYVMENGRTEHINITENVYAEITYGKLCIDSSDCPNQICVRTGWISKKGEKIVCLPKKLIIEIE